MAWLDQPWLPLFKEDDLTRETPIQLEHRLFPKHVNELPKTLPTIQLDNHS